MSKAQHTPGPWSKHPYSCDKPFAVNPSSPNEVPWVAYHVEIGFGDKLIASVNMQTADGGFPCVDNQQECDANARLILVAPELYELAQMVSHLNPNFPEIGEGMLVQLVSMAVSAIKKVEGE